RIGRNLRENRPTSMGFDMSKAEEEPTNYALMAFTSSSSSSSDNEYDRRMNERQMQLRESKVASSKALDASLVITECSRTKLDEHITSSSSRTYITHVVYADIRPINDQEPSA
nr:hypothetical protein [Tanacetum cinerariifolium]